MQRSNEEMSSTFAVDDDEIEQQRLLIGYSPEVSTINPRHHFRFQPEYLELSRNAVDLVLVSASHDLVHARVQP
jgi:hypothetical protein